MTRSDYEDFLAYVAECDCTMRYESGLEIAVDDGYEELFVFPATSDWDGYAEQTVKSFDLEEWPEISAELEEALEADLRDGADDWHYRRAEAGYCE